jgi:DNA-binding NarL/FixJ family response regulator
MIRIVIADDHRLLLEGLREALGSVPDIDVVGTAVDGEELLERVEEHQPDVLVVDIDMPKLDGLSALAAMDDPPPSLIVTMHTDEAHRAEAEAAGAVAFLSKAAPLPDLAAAIRAANQGERLFGPDLDEILDRNRSPVLDEGAAALTAREREVLALLASGESSTDQLAERLFISQKTVKNHLASIYEKLGVGDRTQAAVEAIRLGLITGSSAP